MAKGSSETLEIVGVKYFTTGLREASPGVIIKSLEQ